MYNFQKIEKLFSTKPLSANEARWLKK